MIRIMIGLLLAGSVFLGWQAMQQRETIALYESAVSEGGEAEQVAQRILRSAYSYTQYKERSAKEGVKGDGADQVNSYIFGVAADPNVLWGNPRIEKPREVERMKGYTDLIYTIKPAEKDAWFDRARIANFFFLLEKNSRKLRITNIDLRAAQKNLKPHEIPEDRWYVDLKVTMRERKK
jgi:hypothetical protein